MKKTVSLILALMVLLALVSGCVAENNNPTGSTPAGTTETTEGSDATTGSTGVQYDVISIEKALELCGEPGNVTEEKYYIRGTIKSITNPAYGAMVITDGTNSISVYGTEGYSSMSDKPFKGDEVLLYCVLQNYNGNKEIKSAQIIEFEHAKIEVDESKYTDMSIAEVREAEEGKLVKVDGVVAQITYANGKIPAGVVLVDDTSSIYVYDGDLAGRAQVGNEVTILGSKTWWVLGDEAQLAAKFGYKGCCQLESVTVLNVSNDKKEFNKSWIKETTVKEMMDTPVSQDITSLLFKVNALVTKAPGNGFTNYYFNDLDGKTGSYTYTQCNGSDFGWLDQFDGKICTVYLMVLNAKSTTSGCVYRFLPVAVSDDGFKFDTANTSEFVVKYHGVGQFLSNYTGNPKLELITSVSSDLLGFKDAKLSYSSDNESVVSFKTEGGKTVMHCLSTGKANVTVTATYGGKTYSEKVIISAEVKKEEIKAPTVAEVIAAKVGDTVTVKGIVGPSLVNQSGFYLIDKTGIIAVLTDEATMGTIEIGQEVVLSGTRYLKTKDKEYGQTCIKDAAIVSNSYGNTPYETSFFVTDKTVTDIYNLDVHTDYTTTVFVVKATVVLEESKYYTNILLSDGNKQLRLYCSNAKQYNWLKEYAGQEVTVEVAACNWNSKDYYTGCALAVRNADGTKILNTLNFDK